MIPTRQPVDSPASPSPDIDETERFNEAHLRFVEEWTGNISTVVLGVDLVRCMAYELIQHLNNATAMQLAQRAQQLEAAQ